MEVRITNELYVFLCTVLAGISIGVVYDLFRVVRGRVKVSGLFTDIQDILFWVISTGIVFFVVFTTNNGKVRWYEFFGVILGMVFYFSALSRIFRRILNWILDIIVKIFFLCFKIVLTPLLFLYNIISKPILYFMGVFRRIGRKLQKSVSRRFADTRRAVKIKLTKK